MTRIGLFPGSFDPPSLGHIDIIRRASHFCDRLIVAVAIKPEKNPLFSLEEKMEMLKIATHSIPHVEIAPFHGLVVDFAKEKNVHFLVRGLRAFSDVEGEFQMALANRRLSGIETIFLMADERLAQVSSSLIREIAHFNGPLTDFVPKEIEHLIRKKKNPDQNDRG